MKQQPMSENTRSSAVIQSAGNGREATPESPSKRAGRRGGSKVRIGCYRRRIYEVTNYNAVISLALDQGFNALLPVYDGGVDLPSSASVTACPAKCD